MRMTPSGPVRMGITPLVRQPAIISDGKDGVIEQRVITVSYNAGKCGYNVFARIT